MFLGNLHCFCPFLQDFLRNPTFLHTPCILNLLFLSAGVALAPYILSHIVTQFLVIIMQCLALLVITFAAFSVRSKIFRNFR